MSAVSTVVISALVSGAVTLSLEGIAKPRLDARKERILDTIKSRRRFEDNMLKISMACAAWIDFKYPPDLAREQRELVDAERRRAFQRVDDASKEMVDDLWFYALTYVSFNLPRMRGSIPVMISRYVYAVCAIFISSKPYTVKAERIHELTEPMRIALFGGRWHLIRRINAFHKIPNILDKYAPDGKPKPDGSGEKAELR